MADFFGIATGNKMTDKFERTGYTAVKSTFVNAPIIDEFPVVMECELAEVVNTESFYCIVGKIVNTAAEESVLDESGKVREPLKHYLARQLTPDTIFSFHEQIMEGKRMVLLEIAAAKKVPTAFMNIRYFRIGSSKVVLTKYPDREAELFNLLQNGQPSLINTAATRQDLTFDKLIVYYASKGITLNKRTFKRNLGFLMPDGKYNLLAQLLSDDSGITIRFAIFSGKDKTSTMYSVREIGRTCLLYSLDKALELGELLNVPQADERNRVVERKEVMLFNPEACHEAIVNAFVHNRWTDFNSPMFCAYSDHLEILSHGPLPPQQTLQGFFDGVSVPVNRELSDIFLQLHISERTGRGVPKIINAY